MWAGTPMCLTQKSTTSGGAPASELCEKASSPNCAIPRAAHGVPTRNPLRFVFISRLLPLSYIRRRRNAGELWPTICARHGDVLGRLPAAAAVWAVFFRGRRAHSPPAIARVPRPRGSGETLRTVAAAARGPPGRKFFRRFQFLARHGVPPGGGSPHRHRRHLDRR